MNSVQCTCTSTLYLLFATVQIIMNPPYQFYVYDKVINSLCQDSDDYRSLQRSYELIIKQLEEERRTSEKLRSEIIIVRQDTDKTVREVCRKS